MHLQRVLTSASDGQVGILASRNSKPIAETHLFDKKRLLKINSIFLGDTPRIQKCIVVCTAVCILLSTNRPNDAKCFKFYGFSRDYIKQEVMENFVFPDENKTKLIKLYG